MGLNLGMIFLRRKITVYQEQLYSSNFSLDTMNSNSLHLQCKYFMDMVDCQKQQISDNILEHAVVDQLNESDTDLLNLLTTEEDCTAILNNIATNEHFEGLIDAGADFVHTDEMEQFINKTCEALQSSQVIEERKSKEGFRCDHCEIICSSKKLLKKHLLIHTKERTFPCNTCGKLFRHNYEVTAHERSHNKPTFQCDICSKMFIHRSHLNVHRKKHLGEYVAFCKDCNVGFVSQALYKTHRNTQHDNVRLICDNCGAKLSTLSALKEHKQTHDANHGKQRSHVCEICGKSYLTSRNLRGHTKIHSKVRPYICSICGKSVSSKNILETHLKMHTGVKDFHCRVCDKTFASKEYLAVHQRTHTGDKPFECTLCGKRFTQKTSLTVHIRYHTGQRPYKCECGKEFTTKSHLMTHYKTHDVGGVDIEYISRPLMYTRAGEQI
ncbi:hypothetical protein NQ318_020904 [Aromia moschata]|uniref:C2H2-type domain-containing protein n=1 Tax=Aromia moschata TaxID=1265417 RepID=A0AAV8XYS9_9CUCU|nr:hypothetical protein NQ318_020904 [Aromia moschata]